MQEIKSSTVSHLLRLHFVLFVFPFAFPAAKSVHVVLCDAYQQSDLSSNVERTIFSFHQYEPFWWGELLVIGAFVKLVDPLTSSTWVI